MTFFGGCVSLGKREGCFDKDEAPFSLAAVALFSPSSQPAGCKRELRGNAEPLGGIEKSSPYCSFCWSLGERRSVLGEAEAVSEV